MTPEEKLILEDRISISRKIIRKISNERSVVRVSWSRYGIADIGTTSNHYITIFENGSTVPGFPKTFIGKQAYNANYSVMLDTWNPNSSYEIRVNINSDIDVVRFYLPDLGAIPEPALEPFRQDLMQTRIRNTERGVQITLGGECSRCLNQIRNITIQKMVGSGTLVDTFTSSVPTSLTISDAVANFPYVVQAYDVNESFTPGELTYIYNARDQLLIYYVLSGSDYQLVSDLSLIATYREEEIVRVSSIISINSTVHNDVTVLYYDGVLDQYYRYRQLENNIPYQGVQQTPEITSIWSTLQGFNSGLQTFDIYLDGTASDSGDTATIYYSLMSDIKDFTSFSTTAAFNSPALDTLLPPGVTFMDTTLSHVDTDVVDDLVYTYKVVVTTLLGDTYDVYEGTVERETPTSSDLPSGVTEENLELPVNPDNTLNERDFISGPTTGQMRVTLSEDPEDYKQYLITKEKESNASCLI